MPYINEIRREPVVQGATVKTVGELNFKLSQVMDDYLSYTEPVDAPSYTKFNNAIGVLECLKMELYRRMVAPYEDLKIKENGDVFSDGLLGL